jgi:Tol biopolymer transport system component
VRPHFGDSDSTANEVINVATGAVRPLTNHLALQGYPSFSPDGSRLTYWYWRYGDLNNVNEIHLAPVSGGEGTNLTRVIDRNLVQAIWMPDGKGILVGGHDGTRVSLSVRLCREELGTVALCAEGSTGR